MGAMPQPSPSRQPHIPAHAPAPVQPHRPAHPATIELFASCLGCKWSLPILWQLRDGPRRPSALRAQIRGISPKILTERLMVLIAHGLVQRIDRSVRTRLVDYHLTPLGLRFAEHLAAVDQLMHDLDRSTTSPPKPMAGQT